jgi:hypothetical protein
MHAYTCSRSKKGGRMEQEALVEELQTLVGGSGYGRNLSVEAAVKVQDVINQLAQTRAPAAGSQVPALDLLAGRWELLYTTESSVHKIVGGLVLGLAVASISQCFSRSSDGSGRVVNRIQFVQFGAAIEASAPATSEGPVR